MCLAVLDSGDKTIFSAAHHPKPINSEKWGDFCLSVRENALSKVWTVEEDDVKISLLINIARLKIDC